MIERISHYRIVVRIGRGAMGEVYHAIDERLGRPVALKLLPASISDSADSQSRLLREAQAASALNHPGIVTVHDIGAWEGRVFMVMELVEGGRFTDTARAGIALTDALALVADAADALGAAHARSIFHRDIKSDNLMRTREGRAKVLDFGLAKLRDSVVVADQETKVRTGETPRLDNSEAHALTLAPPPGGFVADDAAGVHTPIAEQLESSERARTPITASSSSPSETIAGSVLGTPAYMSPEQATGQNIDATSEVFSLGVVLYELVTGSLPFKADSIEGTIQAILSAPIVPPSRRAPPRKIPPFVDALVLRALERDRARRYPDMPAFAASLRAARQRLAGRRGARLLVGGALAVVATLGGGAALVHRRHVPAATPKITTVRRITFDSGCEEYPSVLRDGHTVIYDGMIDGDYELFSLDLATATRTRLTTFPGWDWAARPSPDERALAWEHNSDSGAQAAVGDLHHGVPRLLGPIAGVPGWTADGKLLASDSAGTEVERVDVTTGARTTLFTVPGNSLRTAIALPKDRTLTAFLVGDTLSIGIVDPRGRTRSVVEGITTHSTDLAVAPSQRAFYYTRFGGNAHELVRHAFDGDDETLIPGGSTPVTIAFAPDGKHLVYSTCAASEFIAHVEPDGRAATLIGGEASRARGARVLDRDRMLFSSNRAGPSQIWLYDSRGPTYTAVTNGEGGAPAPSPDGRFVAYVDQERGGLSISPIGGGAARVVTSDRTDNRPAFTHDGRALVFERGSEKTRIWSVSIDGTGARPISDAPASYPAASPIEDLVVYLQTIDGKSRIVRTSLAADAQPGRLDVELPSGDLTALVFSPDGQRIALARNTQELVELSLAPGSRWRSRWKTPIDAVRSMSYDASGKSFVVELTHWEGDLWLADGDFP